MEKPTTPQTAGRTPWMRTQHRGIQIEFVIGDMARQPEVAAVVNAANAELMPGGGISGVLHAAAGPGLAEECRPLAPIQPGQAVITGGHRLPNDRVIHCLGPVYGVDEPGPELLADCYRNALRLADAHQLPSIAFPAISAGSFGYPFIEATEIACRAILETIPLLKVTKRIRLVFISPVSANLGCTILSHLIR